MNAAVSGLARSRENNGTVGVETAPRGHESRKPEPCAPGKDFDDWDFTFNGYEGTLDPAYPALVKTARQSPTVVMATPPHEQQSATLLYLLTMLTQKGSTESGEKSWKQRFRSLQTTVPDVWSVRSGRQHGTIRANHDLQVFDSKIEDVEDRLNEFLELVSRYGEANGTDPVPDQVKKDKIADTLPKFQTDYIFIRTVAESKSQPCITFVETRSGVVISFMCARKGGYEDPTKEILRDFEAYSFLNPVIIQCDKEMSIIDVCRKVARERNARTVLRFAPKTSHQSNGFVEAVHGHMQGLARCYQTQIETNTGVELSAMSPAIPFATRYAGIVLSRFTVRPDGRTPFRYLLGTICITFVHVWVTRYLL